MTSSTSRREAEEEMVLQGMQEGILQFTAAAWACWGWQGRQQPARKAAQEITLGKPFSFKRADYILFLILPLQLHVEEVRKPAIFLSAVLTHFPRLSLWALQAWRALASCYCSGRSILLWTLSLGLDHKSHVWGPQKRICCTVYCSSARTENSKLF